MKFGTFYLLPQKYSKKDNTFNYIEYLIFNLTLTNWRAGKDILIACENEHQAKKIDEVLWECDKNSFLPHNLFKKNMHYTPVVIYWTNCYYNNTPKNILINLMPKNMNFFFNFKEIIDFVPKEEILKKLARNRYQSYKKTGFQLRTINPLIL